jgi:starch synthase
MLAMRAGQPCVVNAVGGLRDTVEDGETGFVFHGDNPGDQAQAFVDTVIGALELRAERPVRWAGIAQRAERLRFDWDTAARQYIERMYETH